MHSLLSGRETTGIPKVITEVEDERQSDFVIIQQGSQRNGEILIVPNGYHYSFRTDCICKDKRIYRCRVKGCKAYLDFYNTANKVTFYHGHTHDRKFDNAMQPEFFNKVKARGYSNPFENAHLLVSNMYKLAGSDRQFIRNEAGLC